tara:strand:- start:81 stop:614 length:534 start_codon:yes stop_codon:yes gene_type:complete
MIYIIYVIILLLLIYLFIENYKYKKNQKKYIYKLNNLINFGKLLKNKININYYINSLPKDNKPDDDIIQALYLLQYKYNPNNLNTLTYLDYISTNPSKIANTINKKIINICIDNNINFNSIKYIYIHEVSHVICKEYGHTVLFWKIYNYLLKECLNLKLINKYSNNKIYGCNKNVKL